MRAAGVRVAYEDPVRLLAVTVNPFFPAFAYSSYIPSSIDARALKEGMMERVRVPVVDVVAESVTQVWKVIGSLSGG
jgi:hypothetical protein